MKAVIKPLILIFLTITFGFTSCGDSIEEGQNEDLQGIRVATSRSSVETDGVGIACNFSKIFEEHFSEERFEEIKDEVRKEAENDEEFDEDEFDEFFEGEKFDELLEMVFGGFKNKTFYTITEGEIFSAEFDKEVGAAGEGFSISWIVDAEEPAPGVYEAKGVKFNIEDPDDLENGAEFSVGDIQVTLTDITDEEMIGSFEGTVSSKTGVDEAISGEFNVERVSCEQ